MDELTEQKYIFVIKNYDKFLADNDVVKKRIENYLLPFWDDEVERVVVGGKRKDFNIYLVSSE